MRSTYYLANLKILLKKQNKKNHNNFQFKTEYRFTNFQIHNMNSTDEATGTSANKS